MVRRSLRQLFQLEQYRWLFAGNTAMFFGFFGTILLRSLLAWEIAQDEMILAYVNLVAALCMFVTSLFSGTLIDRFERRKMLLIAQLAVFIAESLILVLLIVEKISIPYLIVSAMASSIAFPFIMPARTAMLVEVVGKVRLAKATAFLTTGTNLARMISPALMGLFADSLGFVFCYVLLLSFHVTSLLCTFRLHRYPVVESIREHFLRETLKGFAYIIKRSSLGWCILFGVLPLMIVIPLQNLMVVYVEELWGMGGGGLGVMMAAMGVGGVLGSLSIALINENRLVKPLVFGTLLMTGLLVLFAHSPYFWMGVIVVLGIYGSSMFTNTLVNTAVQLMAEDYIRGRVTSITMMSISLAPIGTIPLAFASKHIGSVWALTAAAVLLTVAVLLIWGLSKAFRNIDNMARQ